MTCCMLQAPPALPPEEPKRKKSRWDEAKHDGLAVLERCLVELRLSLFASPTNIKSLN